MSIQPLQTRLPLEPNAHVSVVGGYDNSAGSLSSTIISDHAKTMTDTGGGGHNAIYGGASHTITCRARYAMIAGGRRNTIDGSFGLVSGPDNTAGGTSSVVVGQNNVTTCDANGSMISGAQNIMRAPYANIRNVRNEADGAYSDVNGHLALMSTAY